MLVLVLGCTRVSSASLHPPLRCQTLDVNVWVSCAPLDWLLDACVQTSAGCTHTCACVTSGCEYRCTVGVSHKSVSFGTRHTLVCPLCASRHGVRVHTRYPRVHPFACALRCCAHACLMARVHICHASAHPHLAVRECARACAGSLGCVIQRACVWVSGGPQHQYPYP